MKKMLRFAYIALGFVLLVFVQPVFGQQNSLLWKITGNGLEKPSYLFGTIHLICPDDFVMNESILSALGQTEKLVLEINMADPKVMASFQQVSINPGMKNIKDQFSEENRATVDAFFKTNFQAGLDQLGILKPFVLSSMVTMKSMDCPVPNSYEMYFIEEARKKSMAFGDLETVESQIAIFDKMPIEEQIWELEKSILDPKENKEKFATMVAKYKSQDIEGLLQIMAAEEMMVKYKEELLDRRNQDWIPKIAQMAKEGPVFFAVGAGHLGGEQGVIALLREAGYKVEAVK